MIEPAGASAAELVHALQAMPAPAQGLPAGLKPLGVQYGLIISVNPAPPLVPTSVGITLAGSSAVITGVGFLSNLIPVVSTTTPQVVAIVNSGSDYLVVGALTAPGDLIDGMETQPGLIEASGPGGSSLDPIALTPSGVGNDALTVQNAPLADTGLTLTGDVGSVTLSTSGELDVTGGSVVVTATDQATIQSHSGNVTLLAAFLELDAEEAYFQSTNSSPTVANLDLSSFALWLTDTPGATALNIVAKDSAGTVRRATIALA